MMNPVDPETLMLHSRGKGRICVFLLCLFSPSALHFLQSYLAMHWASRPVTLAYCSSRDSRQNGQLRIQLAQTSADFGLLAC